jgi:hypothetical protein
MSINLKDITDAVKDYLKNKVTVTISTASPQTGDKINPNEPFTFKVTAANSTAENGGVALHNVRYRVSVVDPAVVKLRVPPTTSGSATNLAGAPLTAGALVGEMIFDPKSSDFDLGAGDTDTLIVAGVANSDAAGGTTEIRAGVVANIDLHLLFPSASRTATPKPIEVIG